MGFVAEMSSFVPLSDSRPDDAQWPAAVWPVRAGTVLRLGDVSLSLAEPVDAPELFAALDHDRVWTHVKGRPASPDGWVIALNGAPAIGRTPWTVRLDGKVVGTTSFLEVSPGDARLEIGFTTYAPSVWGTIINPACKLLLMQWAFETAHMGRVQLKTDIRNARSQAAIARLGARFEGVLRRYQRRADDTVRDTVMFSVLAEEWPDVKRGLEARVAEYG
jgi:RimJ/RimL family protein N-acetyltransferase